MVQGRYKLTVHVTLITFGYMLVEMWICYGSLRLSATLSSQVQAVTKPVLTEPYAKCII